MHVAPSRDQTTGARASTARGQGHGTDIVVQGGRPAEFDHHDVVIQVAAAVFGVADDLRRVDGLLSALVHSDVVLSEMHLNAAVERRFKMGSQ